jgi:hypothetical protein
VAAVAIVGVELAVPEERIAQPFLLRVPEQRLDLRAHVELAHVLVEPGQEGDGRDLLDQAVAPRSGIPVSIAKACDIIRRMASASSTLSIGGSR